jgi:hypothetical protein
MNLLSWVLSRAVPEPDDDPWDKDDYADDDELCREIFEEFSRLNVLIGNDMFHYDAVGPLPSGADIVAAIWPPEAVSCELVTRGQAAGIWEC